MNHAHRLIATMLFVVILAACGGGRPAATDAQSSPSPTPPGASTPGPAPGTTEPSPAPDVDPMEAERVRRQAEAQAYMDQARNDAETRHRRAVEACAGQVGAEADACVTSADQTLEAEMRAARVEFDQRMMRGE